MMSTKQVAKYLPASKVYIEYGIPRNMLRTYAEQGKIHCKEIPIPDCDNVMRTYCVADIIKLLNEA